MLYMTADEFSKLFSLADTKEERYIANLQINNFAADSIELNLMKNGVREVLPVPALNNITQSIIVTSATKPKLNFTAPGALINGRKSVEVEPSQFGTDVILNLSPIPSTYFNIFLYKSWKKIRVYHNISSGRCVVIKS